MSPPGMSTIIENAHTQYMHMSIHAYIYTVIAYSRQRTEMDVRTCPHTVPARLASCQPSHCATVVVSTCEVVEGRDSCLLAS